MDRETRGVVLLALLGILAVSTVAYVAMEKIKVMQACYETCDPVGGTPTHDGWCVCDKEESK